MQKLCSNAPCPLPAVCKGRCNKCYKHHRRYGTERPLVAPTRPTTCGNPHCGAASTQIRKGRCPACYKYRHRHGRDRTGCQRKPAAICNNCGRSPHYSGGRCSRCYFYFRRTGQERPATLPPKACNQPHRCANPCCPKVVQRGRRCGACQRYIKKHGAERPLSLINRPSYRHAKIKPKRCKVCGDPKVRSFGRCDTCARYYKKHNGAARPRYLWDKDATCAGVGCGVLLRLQKKTRRGYCGRCYNLKKEQEKQP